MDRTAGVRAKLHRAEKHIDDLSEAIRLFIEAGNYSVTTDLHVDLGECIVYARVTGEEERIAEWGVMIGDVIHNLRSALDHLVYQLACLTRDPPKYKTKFPVCWRPNSEYVDRCLRGIEKGDRDAIERLQPYERSKHAPKTDPLWILHDLWNGDKHRLPAVTAVAGDFTELRPHTRNVRIVELERIRPEDAPVHRYEHGAPIARYTVVQTGPNPEMKVNAYGTFSVVLDKGTPAPGKGLFQALTEMRMDVADILLAFTGRLT